MSEAATSDGLRRGASRAAALGLGGRVLAVTAGTAAAMTAFEVTKEAALPELSKWGSHTLTIAITTVLGAIAATYVGRRQREQTRRIQRDEENLRITLESIGDAVVATDRDGQVVRMNPVAAKLTGFSEDEARGRPIEDVLVLKSAETKKPAENPVRRVLETGKVAGLANHTVLVRKDGVEFAIADSGAPIRNERGEIMGVVIVFRDVTAEHRLRMQASQVDKLDALGMLAGGIAHDFNNALAGILGGAELIRLDVAHSNPSLVPQIDVIVDTAKRARDLTGRLLAFARQQALASQPVDAHSAVRNAVALLERSIDKRILIELDLGANPSIVRADAAQLSSVFLNLGINAMHAMPGGGTLVFSSKVVELDAAYCKASPFELEPGAHLEVQVRDTGHGIPVENLPKIFDPFFTTKDQGEGTGLGLAMVYGAMKQHRGAVTAYSEAGKGTLFRLLFPLCETPRVASAPQTFVRGAGRILLIEDETAIRGVAKQFLTRMGYQVAIADSGVTGLEQFKAAAGAFDLVILDMVMPEMSGPDCFHELKKLEPNVKVLLCSGFAGGADVDALKSDGAVGFIAKPYELAELSKAVAGAISEDRAGV